jgi:hypothetical protein
MSVAIYQGLYDFYEQVNDCTVATGVCLLISLQ